MEMYGVESELSMDTKINVGITKLLNGLYHAKIERVKKVLMANTMAI